MDILDILLDILLKPPQPFIGLFLCKYLSTYFFLTHIPTPPTNENLIHTYPDLFYSRLFMYLIVVFVMLGLAHAPRH